MSGKVSGEVNYMSPLHYPLQHLIFIYEWKGEWGSQLYESLTLPMTTFNIHL